MPIILVAAMIVLFSTVLPAQGFPTTNPSALPAGSFFVVQQIGANSTGVRVDSLATKAGLGAYLPLAGGTMTGNILMTSNSIIGGSTTTSDLNLQTTSGVGTTGADMHFLVGNNGATEAMTILNSGNVGIGTTLPTTKLEIVGDFKQTYTNTTADPGDVRAMYVLPSFSGNITDTNSPSLYGSELSSTFTNTISGNNGELTMYGQRMATTFSPVITGTTVSAVGYGARYTNIWGGGTVGATTAAIIYGLNIVVSGNMGTTGTQADKVGASFSAQSTGNNNYGIQVTAASATNNRGINIIGPTLAATNYAIYSSATAQSYFAGNVGIGTTAPSSKLDILGTTQTGSDTTGAFLSTQTSNATSGTLAQDAIVGTFAAGAGSASYRPLSIAYTINNSGAQSGTATGIFLNATETALNSMTHNLMDLQVGGVSKFRVTNTGATTILTSIDVNAGNLTVSGGYVQTTSTGKFNWASRARISSPATNTILLTDSSEADFSRLQFGGTTSSFPAIKRDGAFLRFMVADTSALTPVFALGRAYDATSWNGSARLVDENSVRDKIEALFSSLSSAVAVGSALSMTTSTPLNIDTLVLTTGKWLVSGNVNFSESAATTTAHSAGITIISATIPTDGTQCYSNAQSIILTGIDGITVPPQIVTISGTTNIYLVGSVTFSAGTVAGFGSISAWKI